MWSGRGESAQLELDPLEDRVQEARVLVVQEEKE